MDVETLVVALLTSGAFNTLCVWSVSQHTKKHKDITACAKANRLLMKNELRRLCMHYIEQNWTYEDELDDIIAMHSCYHNDLEGNGFLDTQMNNVKKLEVRGVGVK